MRTKKAQIKMGENVAVLIIFFVLLTIGIMAYAVFSKSSAEKQLEEIKGFESVETVEQIAFMPELQCSFRTDIESACIDLLKASAFSNLVKQDLNYYFETLGYSEITLQLIYPDYTDRVNDIIIYSNKGTKESTFLVITQPVVVYNPISDNNNMGVLVVKVYD